MPEAASLFGASASTVGRVVTATAAEKLSMAAEVIQRQPAALQLRYLQTLVEIGMDKNTTIVFPLPVDIISSLGRALDRAGQGGKPAADNT